ncbi:hypothetical protein HWC54_gp206 [Klebsiella phage Marfa]|uniref:Uncharacterized protein n=1 Tax=Klebsiella phage Marfa TaxID=2587809 RepID=A0A4Y5TRA9_9CAUD|nr:hypothetical protein HWC54_gp206 [Klebsiella phage Marfa]QDB71866.1 hypothetical protein CPT_Marfa_221 [Klebsiella phage Marfa]
MMLLVLVSQRHKFRDSYGSPFFVLVAVFTSPLGCGIVLLHQQTGE